MIRNNTDHSEEYHAIEENNDSDIYNKGLEGVDEEPQQKHHDLVKKYFYSKAYKNALKAREQNRERLSEKARSSESQLIKKAENLAEKEEEIYKYLSSQGEVISDYKSIQRGETYAIIRDAENYIIFKMPEENHSAKGPGFVDIFTPYLDFDNHYGEQEIKEDERIHLEDDTHFKTLGVFHLNENSELKDRFEHFVVHAEK